MLARPFWVAFLGTADMRTVAATLILLGVAFSAQGASAEPEPVVTLTLKDHRFMPATATVPSGQRIQVVLVNQDRATEEFDSHDLKVEKLVTPGATIRFTIGPLKAGAYSFMGEFHPQTAQGRLTVQ